MKNEMFPIVSTLCIADVCCSYAAHLKMPVFRLMMLRSLASDSIAVIVSTNQA